MAQYHVDEYIIELEMFGHVILQWTSILCVLYLLIQNVNELNVLTKTWLFYLLSQIFVCTAAYMRLSLAPYVSFLYEQMIWYCWRFFVSLLGMALISLSVLFMYSFNPNNKHKIIAFFKFILPIWAIIYYIILFALCIFVPFLRDLYLFSYLIIAVIMEAVTYRKFINLIIDDTQINESSKYALKILKINIYITIFNAVSFIIFNTWFVVKENGVIGIIQRVIGALFYAFNTYSLLWLSKMKYFNQNKQEKQIVNINDENESEAEAALL